MSPKQEAKWIPLKHFICYDYNRAMEFQSYPYHVPRLTAWEKTFVPNVLMFNFSATPKAHLNLKS